MLLSVPLALEYEAKCHVPEHRRASGLSANDIDIFVNTLIVIAEPVQIRFLWRPQLRDSNDEMVLEAAVNGNADAIVSFNQRDFRDAPAKFGIRQFLPREALRKVQG
jgi:predicted nucleic acid-binding protein